MRDKKKVVETGGERGVDSGSAEKGVEETEGGGRDSDPY